jgi:hypothetical protein
VPRGREVKRVEILDTKLGTLLYSLAAEIGNVY